MNERKKIFISGVAGFMGSHLAKHFLDQGHHVVGCDNLIGGYLDNVPAEVEFYQYDCNYLNSMIKITRGVDIIFHTAATAYEGLSVFSPFVVTQNIVGASSGVITAGVVNKVKRIVNCSSMARYGENEVPFHEGLTPKPQDPYGIGKVAVENLLKNLCEVHGVQWVNAVPHNIIGPHQKYDDPYRNVAAIMINLMLQGRQPIIYGDGTQKRCFSFIGDVVDCLDALAWNDNVVGETINIGPDEEFVTINELAETIADLLDFKLEPKYMPDRPQEVFLANCSSDKARRLLGYSTKYTLRKGLQEMIDYIRERGTRPFKYHLDIEIVNEKTPKTWTERMF